MQGTQHINMYALSSSCDYFTRCISSMLVVSRQISAITVHAHADMLSKLSSLPSVKLFLKVLLAERLKQTKRRKSINKILDFLCMVMCICICVGKSVHLKDVEGQGKREGDSGDPFLERLFLVFASPSHLTRNLRERRGSCQLISVI